MKQILCIKLVKYWDKYTEMHGQQNVIKMTTLIVAFRKFANTPIKDQFAVYLKVDEFLYIPTDSIPVCFIQRNSGVIYYICIIYTPRISTSLCHLQVCRQNYWRCSAHVAENCAPLGYYAASSGNFLPTFRENLSALSSGVKDVASNNFLPTFQDNLSVQSWGVKDQWRWHG